MRKIISVCLVLALVLSLSVAVFAAGAQVKFTSASTFQVGGSAKVDVLATCQSVMQGNPTSDMYNAALEQNIDVMWRCSNGPDKYGSPITWTADDAGKEYVCRVSFYADKAKTEFVDYIDSSAFTVAAGQTLKFITTELHDAVKGESYYVQVATTDSKAVFSEIMGSELSSFGLTLHSNGIIDGTPTKTGNCHINLLATGPSGEDSASFDLTVTDGFAPSLEVLDYPTQITYMVGETFNPAGMRVKITTFDGSTMISKDGQYLEYTKEPLKNQGDVKIKLKHGDAFTFVYITVVPASGAGGAGDMPPAITLKSLPTANVGEAYYVRIDCGDLDAEFCEYYNPGKANELSKTGLTLAKNGVLSGTPKKAGSYTFTICAANEQGEDYATYTLIVKEAAENPPEETEPEATTPTEAPTETPTDIQTTAPEATEGSETTGKVTKKPNKTDTDNSGSDGSENNPGDMILLWVIVAAVAVLLSAGVIVLIIILVKKKKIEE